MIITTLPKMSITGLIIIFYSFFPLVAAGIHTSIPTPLMKIDPNGLPKTSWATALNKTMSTTLCQEGSHWRNCYDLSSDQCIQFIDNLTQACTAKTLDILPPTLTPTVADLAGRQVGFCVGALFYKLAQPQLKSVPECQQKPQSSVY